MTTDFKMKPILLNGKGCSKSLQVTIGGLTLELWDFTHAEGKPHVRLVLDSRNGVEERNTVDQDEESTPSYIDLDAMQASALSMAIDRWMQSFESNMPDNSAPSMSLKIGPLSLVFFGPGRKRAGHVRLALARDRSGRVTTKLTRVEANVLGALLDSLIHKQRIEGTQ